MSTSTPPARRTPALLVVTLLASLVALAAPAGAAPEGPTQLISVNAEGTAAGNDQSQSLASVSDDGRYIVFESRATDLVTGLTDANGPNLGDVYLRDTTTGQTRLVSHAAGSPTTTATGGSSGAPRISADGRYVVFETFATNLVTGVVDANGERDVYVHAVATGTTALVSHADGSPTTTCDTGQSVGADISDDGSFIAFQSPCTDLVDEADVSPGVANVYRHDRAAGTTEVVSRPNAVNPNDITTGNAASTSPDISGQGNVVVYTTQASNLGPADTNGAPDIGYWRAPVGNLPTLSTTITSFDGASTRPTVSDDGIWVAFESDADDIGPTDTNGAVDVYLAEVTIGQGINYALVSDTPGGGDAGNQASFKPVVSGDGGSIAFLTRATDIVSAAPTKTSSAQWDVVRHTRAGGAVSLISRGSAGGGGDGDSGQPGQNPGLAISDDGQTVLFTSAAANLVPVDGDAGLDVYAYESPGGVRLISAAADGTSAGDGPSSNGVLSSDGDKAVFRSDATDLTAVPDANGDPDVHAVLGQITPTLSIDDVTGPEGQDGESPLTFTITLAPAVAGEVTVQYATADGTATGGPGAGPGVDYRTASGTATIPAGQTEATVEVVVFGDADPEGDEDFTVTLSDPTGGAVIGPDMGTGTGTIADDDGVVTADLRDGVNDTLRVVVDGGPPANANHEIALRYSRALYPTPDGMGPDMGPDDEGDDPGFAQEGGDGPDGRGGGTPGAREALLATDGGFADALASGALQGSTLADGRPLLLTATDQLYPEVLAELQRLQVETVHILGGTAAIDAGVETALVDAGYTVNRYEGPSRLETATDIAGGAFPQATTAVLARAFPAPDGDDTQAFADSLAAGAWAAERGWPLLFTQTEVLSTSTREYLAGSAIETVYVVGGTAAISDAVITQLTELGITVERVAGDSRFDTALAIAAQRGHADERDAEQVMLLDGQQMNAWVAGFAGAGWSAINGAPVVLAVPDVIPGQTAAFLDPPPGGSEEPEGPSFAVDEQTITGYVLVCGITPVRCDEARSLLGLPDLATIVEPTGEHPAGGTATFELTGPFDASGYETLLECGADQDLAMGGPLSHGGEGPAVEVGVSISADAIPGPCTVKVKLIWPNGSEQIAVTDITVTGS
ncbi:cell wall-binding repeat-containing protein [Euzebya sp.]|uniref:cell wall-binding repeat-containing protein n=1 Tax=Euzebya sp. TaxID=1971409 RepID=UPI003518EBD0